MATPSTAHIISNMDSDQKKWIIATLKQGFDRFVESALEQKGIAPQNIKEIIFTMKRITNTEEDVDTAKVSFATVKKRITTKMHTSWQDKVAQVHPANNDPLLLRIKEDINEMELDSTSREDVDDVINRIYDMQKQINILKPELDDKHNEIKKKSIAGFVKEIEERERKRVENWNKRKQEGSVVGKSAGSAKNKKVTVIYCNLREQKDKYNGIHEDVKEMQDSIHQVKEKLQSGQIQKVMDVSSGQIQTAIVNKSALDRLLMMETDIKRMLKLAKGIVRKLTELTNTQTWISKANARNCDFEDRYNKYRQDLKKRQNNYHTKRKKKEQQTNKNKRIEEQCNNTNNTNNKRKRKRLSSDKEEASDIEPVNMNEPVKKKRKLQSQSKLTSFFK